MVQQKHLSTPAMIAFITFMNMFIPLSTDLYLPAMPSMGAYFGASQALVGLTLTVFFFVFAVSLVLFGPLSDKYGRRPILIAGATLFTAASLVCALSTSIYMLLAGRFLQAVGAGAVITTATALIKDSFSGRMMSRILAITQALSVIAPMAAPIIGGQMLMFTSWRGSFFLLAALGAVNLSVALLLTETLPAARRFQGRVAASWLLLGGVFRQWRFMQALLMFSLLTAGFMAYLSVSSFVYIEKFALSAQQYSYFFACNAFMSVAGPALYLRLKGRMPDMGIVAGGLAVGLLSAVLVLTAGTQSALFFLLSFMPFTVVTSALRPLSMEMLLNRVRENAGTASSVINFVHTLFGSLGMMLGTMPWADFASGLGIIMLVCTLLSWGLFFFVRRSAARESD